MSRAARVVIPTLLVLIVAGCGPDRSDFEGGGNKPRDVVVDCAFPWDSMDQVRSCAAADYELVGADGDQVDIVVKQKKPARIAAALAAAFLANEGNAEQIVVWAWSKRGAVGHGYDRGVASEQGELGELLLFEVCSVWESLPGPSDLCTDTIEFTVEQDGT